MGSEYFVPVNKYKDFSHTTKDWVIGETEIGYIREGNLCIRFLYQRI